MKPGFHRKPQEIGAHPPAEVRLHRLPFCVGPRPGQTHKRQMEQDPKYIQRNRDEIDSQCTDTYVHHWITCIHGENCKTGQDTHETFSMASQDSLESSDALEFSNSLDSQNETTQGMVAKSPKRPSRRIPTPQRSRHPNLYRRIKRRLGRSLKSRLRRRSMVSNRKTPSHKRTGTKGSNPSPTTLLAPMPQETSAGSIRQHNCGSPHKQTGGNPLHRTLCPHVETTHMVQQAPNNTQSTARPRFSQCDCGRPLQEKPNPTHRMVLGSPYLHKDLPTLGTATNRPVCHQPEHQTSNLCVSNPGPTGLGGGRAKHLLEEHDRIRIPSDSIATKSGPETTVPTMQAHPNSPRLADKTVELSLDIPRQLPPIRSLLKQPLNNQFHTQPESLNLHAWYLGAQPSRTKALPQRWQIELLHLKDSLLEPSTPKNGQFSKGGASNNRWTSGLLLLNIYANSCAFSSMRRTDAHPPLRDIGQQLLTH